MDNLSKIVECGWRVMAHPSHAFRHRVCWAVLMGALLCFIPTFVQAQDTQAQEEPAQQAPSDTTSATADNIAVVAELRRVKVSFFLNSITNINDKNGSYDVDCYLDFYWFEPQLEGKRLEDVDPADLWSPALEPVNSQNYQMTSLGYSNSLEPRTNLRLSYRLFGTFYTKFDLEKFPFDSELFTIQLESGEFDSSQLLFDFIEVDSPTIYGDQPIIQTVPQGKYISPDFNIPDWTVGDVQVLQLIHVLPYDKSSWAQFRIDLPATRQSSGYLWRILFQLFLVQALFWAVLFLNSQNLHYRLLLLFTLFMVSVIFNLVLLQNLPHTAYLTFIERYMLLTYSAGALIALVSVVINQLHQRGADAAGLRLNALSHLLYPLLLIAANGLLFWYTLG
jgi:Neurotransmitter-gated ion-channel ligand binding domain